MTVISDVRAMANHGCHRLLLIFFVLDNSLCGNWSPCISLGLFGCSLGFQSAVFGRVYHPFMRLVMNSKLGHRCLPKLWWQKTLFYILGLVVSANSNSGEYPCVSRAHWLLFWLGAGGDGYDAESRLLLFRPLFSTFILYGWFWMRFWRLIVSPSICEDQDLGFVVSRKLAQIWSTVMMI